MSMINKEINDFAVQAFQNGDFRAVTKEEILGKWSVFFFYPADFTFICPTELEDLADKYAEFQNIGCEIYAVSCDTHFVHKAWHDVSEKIKKFNIRCWRIQLTPYLKILKYILKLTVWLKGAALSSIQRVRL